AAGDQMLHIVGERLRQGLRGHDLVARLGGDEFVVVLNAIGRDLEIAQAAAERVAMGLLERLSHPYELKVGMSHHSASIGVAVLDRRSSTADELIQHADVALYAAKGAGRATVRVFDPDMQRLVTQRVQMEQQLRTALDQRELHLHFQGIVDRDSRLCGAEALLRWQPPGRPWVLPERFIPVAEEAGLIHRIGDWSLQRVARVLEQWGDRLDADFRISLNLSARQFLHPEFEARMLRRLEELEIDSTRLKLEITEATVLDDLGKAAQRMNSLREHGIEFSLDDFGTGYSSLSYLRQLPLAEVKIDKSYVREFLSNRSDAAVMRAVLSLCDSLGMGVVAEGVETEAQWRQLRADGCARFQGFLFSHPMEPGTSAPDSLLNGRWREPRLEIRPPA
ncbi:MAG: hypothetical protein RLZZ124_1880, partial [Cyanobacteriota bacterium]